MDFGKLSNVDDINFSLPPDHRRTKQVLKENKSKKGLKIFVGAPVWGDKGFVGKIYPPKTKTSDFLSLYSRQFNCIEMNGTFYKIPFVSDVEKWREQVPSKFIFSPKISQIISISVQKERVQQLTEEFCDSIAHFEKNLGLSFMIPPPHFKPEKIKYLERFLVHFPKGIPLSVELRHPGWYKDSKVMNDVFDMFEDLKITSIITDVSGRRDVLHQRLTTSIAAIRFGANDLHPSDFQRLSQWVDRIKIWKSQGLKTLYFWIHTPKKSLTADLSVYFINQLNKKCGTDVIPPKLIQLKS